MKLQSTKYIQRVKQPTGERSPFVFGGGGGCISDEGWALLLPIFDFDYMGAAEFESGKVPAAINQLGEQPDRSIEEVKIPMEGVNNVARSYKGAKPDVKKNPEPRSVYVVAPKSLLPEITERLIELAKNESRLKAYAGFASALDPVCESDSLIVGWLELDNGFFFSTDKEMAIKFAALIEVPVG